MLTPHLAALADAGVKLEQHYRCCDTLTWFEFLLSTLPLTSLQQWKTGLMQWWFKWSCLEYIRRIVRLMFHILAKTSAAPQELPCLLGGYRVIIINRINSIVSSLSTIFMLASIWSESSGTLSSTYQVSNPHRLPQRCYRAKNPVWTWHLLHNPCPGPGYSLIKTTILISFLWQFTHQLENLSWSSGFKKRCCRRCGEAATPLTSLESGTSACAGSTTIIKTSSSFFFCQCHLPNTYFGTSGPNTH